MKQPFRFALIMAGGTGSRFGAPLPKQMVHVQGIPILVHTLRKFLSFSNDIQICTVLHGNLVPQWDDFVVEFFTKADLDRLWVCEGGQTRTESVHNGLKFLESKVKSEEELAQNAWVAIHDGVRPLIQQRTLQAAFRMAEELGNSVTAVPVKSSMRRKTDSGSEAVDRSQFYHVQTPQTFRLDQILEAYQNRPHSEFTDDASLAEAFGMNIHLCDGDYNNIKITTPEDLYIAEFLLK